MSQRKTELLLADPNLVGSGGAYIAYQQAGNMTGAWRRLDVGAVVKANQEIWLRTIEDWHRKLCESGAKQSNFWWLNNASRLTVWVPYDLRPLLFARAILEICNEREYSRIYLVGLPPEVLGYLIEWERNALAGYKLLGAIRLPQANTSVLVVILRTCLQLARLLLTWIASIRPLNVSARNIDLIVYSTPLAAQTVAQIGDHYFGRAFDHVSGSTLQLEWLYEWSGIRGMRAIKNSLYDTGRTFHFAVGQLRIQDLFAVAVQAFCELPRLRAIANRMPPLTIGEIPCTGFPANFARESMLTIPPVLEIGLFFAFRRHLKLVRPKAVIYPYEEKGSERALILACELAAPPVRTIAYAHAAYCHGHLYVHNSSDISRPTPSSIAVTGNATKYWFNSWGGHPIERLRVIGSPKHNVESNQQATRINRKEKRRVLFLCGIGHEISRLVDFVTAIPHLFDGIELRVRKYPYSWQMQQDQDISRLNRCGVHVMVEEQDLGKEIEWAHVVLFTTTSAALDAMLRNRPCIRIVDDLLDTNPLAGRDHDGVVPNCDSAESLRERLDMLFTMNDSERQTVATAQRSLAREIFSEWSSSSLQELIAFSGNDCPDRSEQPNHAFPR